MQMEQDLLAAAIRVLEKNGGRSFTTIAVAEKAGVSVGSLYQYFPNKESILFRLQEAEWNRTWPRLAQILLEGAGSPWKRLHEAVLLFFQSEAEEVGLRSALDEAGSLIEETPEYQALMNRAHRDLLCFLKEALPRESNAALEFKADFLMTALSSISESVTSRQPGPSETVRWAEQTARLLIQMARSAAPA